MSPCSLGRRLWLTLHAGCQQQLATLDDVEVLARSPASPSAGRRFGEFRLHEEAHMAAEEALLAHFSDAHPATLGRIELLRAGHRRLTAAMQRVSDALCHAHPSEATAALRQLRELVSRHEGQERDLLVPLLEETVTDRGLCELLVAKLAQSS